jgi:hypothetical protein
MAQTSSGIRCQASIYLPKVLAVYNSHRRCGSIEVVEQARIDPNPTGDFVPSSVWLESWAICVGSAAALRAEVMYYKLCIPAIDRIIIFLGCCVELSGLIVSQQCAAL